MAGSASVEPVDLAGVPVDGELILQPIDLVEAAQGMHVSVGRAEGEDDLERGRHRPPAETQMHRRRVRHVGWRSVVKLADDRGGGAGEAPGIDKVAAFHGLTPKLACGFAVSRFRRETASELRCDCTTVSDKKGPRSATAGLWLLKW